MPKASHFFCKCGKRGVGTWCGINAAPMRRLYRFLPSFAPALPNFFKNPLQLYLSMWMAGFL